MFFDTIMGPVWPLLLQTVTLYQAYDEMFLHASSIIHFVGPVIELVVHMFLSSQANFIVNGEGSKPFFNNTFALRLNETDCDTGK